MEELEFRKSSYSGNRQDCVEVADTPRATAIRDSQHSDGGHLLFPTGEWWAFLESVGRGEL